jgi:hypothetical protein
VTSAPGFGEDVPRSQVPFFQGVLIPSAASRRSAMEAAGMLTPATAPPRAS